MLVTTDVLWAVKVTTTSLIMLQSLSMVSDQYTVYVYFVINTLQ